MKRKYPGSYAPMKRRRFTRRRRFRRGKSSALSSQKGNFTGMLYRTKRVPYRRYKRAVYKSLAFKEASRSILTNVSTITTAALATTEKAWATYEIPDNFYETAGGYTGSSTFTTSKFVIKGGMMYTKIRNTGAVPMVVEMCLLRFMDTVHDPNGDISPNAGDISTLAGFGQSFKLVSRVKRHIIEPGDECSVQYRIPFTIINDITTWNATQGKLRIAWSATSSTAGALSYFNERGFNLTFVGDAIA